MHNFTTRKITQQEQPASSGDRQGMGLHHSSQAQYEALENRANQGSEVRRASLMQGMFDTHSDAIENPLGIVTWNVAHLSLPKGTPQKLLENIKKGIEEKTLNKFKSTKPVPKIISDIDFKAIADILESIKAYNPNWENPEHRAGIAKWSNGLKRSLRPVFEARKRLIDIKKKPLANNPDLRKKLSKVISALPSKHAISQFTSSVHSNHVVENIKDMFRHNDWLDVMTLQEVNNPEILERELKDKLFKVHKGPRIQSGDPQNPTKPKLGLGTPPTPDAANAPDKKEKKDSSQVEYYPIILKDGIQLENQYIVNQEGLQKIEHQESTKEPTIRWNKNGNPKTYRPIVVYEIKKLGQLMWIGVVHTTPESDEKKSGSEFNRVTIFDEIKDSLSTLKSEAEKLNIPLIIGGDYYLTAEAITAEIGQEQLEKDNLTGRGLTHQQKQQKKTIKRQYLNIKSIKEHLEHMEPYQTMLKSKLAELKQLVVGTPKIAEEIARLQKTINVYSDTAQLLRNDSLLNLSFEKRIHKLGLKHLQAISGSNPKARPVEGNTPIQIADFFLHNSFWKSAAAGLMGPQGKIISADTEDLTVSKYWAHFSDHFPVAAIFLLGKKDNVLANSAFIQPSISKNELDKFNSNRPEGNGFGTITEHDFEPQTMGFLDRLLPKQFSPSTGGEQQRNKSTALPQNKQGKLKNKQERKQIEREQQNRMNGPQESDLEEGGPNYLKGKSTSGKEMKYLHRGLEEAPEEEYKIKKKRKN
jgi:hypothetical protein